MYQIATRTLSTPLARPRRRQSPPRWRGAAQLGAHNPHPVHVHTHTIAVHVHNLNCGQWQQQVAAAKHTSQACATEWVVVVVVVVLAVVVTHLACDHWGTSPTLCCWQALRNAAKSDGVGREDVIIWCPPGTTTSMCLKLAAAHNLGCKSGSTQRDVGQAEASFVCVWGGRCA